MGPLAAAAFLLAHGDGLEAGGVFYGSNQSAEYIRCFDRNSALDAADIAYYNMAGTVLLRPGLSLDLGNQVLFQRAAVRVLGNPALGDRTYVSRNPVWLVPDAFLVYRRGRWALFTSLQALGATAMRRWDGGLPSMDLAGKQAAGYGGAASQRIAADAYAAALGAGAAPGQARAAAVAAGLDSAPFPASSWLQGSSAFLAWRHGAAWRAGPRLALAAAGRLVWARQDLRGGVTGACAYGRDRPEQDRLYLDVTLRALGYSGELGVDYYPREGQVLSLTYEMATSLAFRTTVQDGRDGGGRFLDGRRAHLDLPQAWRLGFGWQVAPRLRLALGVNAYLEGTAAMDLLDDPGQGVRARRDYRDTWEETAALEWRLESRWLLSLGMNVNQIGQTRRAVYDTSLAGAHGNYLSLGTGFRFEPSPAWRFNFGVACSGFAHRIQAADLESDQALRARFAANGVSIQPRKEYDKRYLILAFGVEWHLPG